MDKGIAVWNIWGTVKVTMVVVMMVVSLSPLCYGRPHQGRRGGTRRFGTPIWHSPCSPLPDSADVVSALGSESGSSSWSADDGAQSVSLLTDQLQFLVNEASLTRQFLAEILNIIESRVRDSNVIAFFNSLSIIRGFPPLDRHLPAHNLTEALARDYQRVSSLAVFVEQARHDTRAYRSHLTATFNHVTGLLCWLEQMSLALCQPVNYSVSRRIMANGVRRLRSSAHRDTRNFLIGRDALALLDGMIGYYEEQLMRDGDIAVNCP